MDAHHMGQRAAEDFIHNVDHERKRRGRLLYGVDVEDPSLYDLTVNLQSISLKTVCGIIAEAAAQQPYEVTDDVKKRLEAFAVTCREQLQHAREG